MTGLRILRIDFPDPKLPQRVARVDGSKPTWPENDWRPGGETRPVAYPSEAIASSGALRVLFEAPAESVHCVRGVALPGNPLGDVRPFKVRMRAARWRVRPELELGALRTGVVGKLRTGWRWQHFVGGRWDDLIVTEHELLTTLGRPELPWGAHDPWGQTPWAEALRLAVCWAIGASSFTQAATAITKTLHARASYQPRAQYVDVLGSAGTTVFRLGTFLGDVAKKTDAIRMNCEDFTAATLTLANLLGCSLRPVRLQHFQGTAQVMMAGSDIVSGQTFGFHELCWEAVGRRTPRTYDASLQLLGPDGTPWPVVDLPFGSKGQHGTYCDMLLHQDGQPVEPLLHPLPPRLI